MDEPNFIIQGYNFVIWGLRQLMPEPFTILIPIVLAASPFLYDTDRFRNFKKHLKVKLSLAALPLFWILIGMWGGIFRFNHDAPNNNLLSKHTAGSLLLFFAACYIIYGCYFLYRNKGYRIITAFLLLVNGYIAFLMLFVAGMSVSGNWI